MDIQTNIDKYRVASENQIRKFDLLHHEKKILKYLIWTYLRFQLFRVKIYVIIEIFKMDVDQNYRKRL